MIITISREFAAGGSDIARRVATALGWTLVDNQCVDEVARRAGLPPEQVAEQEERAPGFFERLARALANANSEYVAPPEGIIVPEMEEARLVRITEAVVEEYAAQGKIVLVGRGASAVLSRVKDALHARLVAPRAERIARAAERLQVDARHAEEVVRERDHARARYHRTYYDREWHDPLNYHMILNTGMLGLDGAADLIVHRARALGWSD